jgi:hypothetical protein
MLDLKEFTVGSLADASVGSLILPRNKHDQTAFVGTVDQAPGAIFLSSEYQFLYVPIEEDVYWHGIIVSNVWVEVDELSAFDPTEKFAPPGSVILKDSHFFIRARNDRNYGRSVDVSIGPSLPSGNDCSVGFLKWQIGIGVGVDKRVLNIISVEKK